MITIDETDDNKKQMIYGSLQNLSTYLFRSSKTN